MEWRKERQRVITHRGWDSWEGGGGVTQGYQDSSVFHQCVNHVQQCRCAGEPPWCPASQVSQVSSDFTLDPKLFDHHTNTKIVPCAAHSSALQSHPTQSQQQQHIPPFPLPLPLTQPSQPFLHPQPPPSPPAPAGGVGGVGRRPRCPPAPTPAAPPLQP